MVQGRILSWPSKAEVKRCGLPFRSNVLGDSVDKDIHYESTRQRKVMKYLRENYYHCIEYSAAYSYSQRFQEGADLTRINTSNLIYTWKVEMKKER